ncbi:MAG: hypothetical protein L3J12_06560, partial [Spirochaetales bacterium]|nr:hypothetical protein [Spirochaetales bacterium]
IVEGKKSLPVIYHIKEKPEDISKINRLFSEAKKKGLKNGEKAILEAISLLEGSGSIDKAVYRAKELLNHSKNIISEQFSRSEAADLIIYMIKNFA